MSVNQYHEYQQHIIPDMEFSGFFELTTNIIGLKYFIFLKYKENIYVEVKNVGDIIMPFKELLKNKLLKMYYDISLLLVKDTNRFVEKISDKGQRIWDAEITSIYKGRRNCFVDCAYILNGVVKTDKQYCYYEMNPFEFKNPNSIWEGFVNTSSEIEEFNNNYKILLGYEVSGFEKRVIKYTNLAIDYNATLMEKKLDELSAIQDDKENIIKLITLNDKKDMNSDIFQVIYNNLVSASDAYRYAPYLANLDNNKEDTIREIVNS